ncbi:transposase [Kurthia sibirica]|uniref:transposase n=1 Tax=Kurthia sibirica TaxID=202750 RepID=UPI0035E94D1A
MGEYKGDTDEPIDILPNRRKSTIKHYLQSHGQAAQIVGMDMNQSFKAAIRGFGATKSLSYRCSTFCMYNPHVIKCPIFKV